MRYVHTFFLALGLLGLSLTVSSADNRVSIAAIVNNKIITKKDLEHRLNLVTLGAPSQPTPEERKMLLYRLLQQMIEETLQLEETAMYGIYAEDDEVSRQVAEIEKNNSLQPGALFKKMQEAGVPKETLLRQIQASIAWAKFVMQLRQMTKVAKTDIEAHMKHKKRRLQDRYLLAEIVLPVSIVGGDEQAEAMAAQIVEELRAGKPFNMIAPERSIAPSAAMGGDIDWVDEDQLAPEIREEISRLAVGNISRPIKTRGFFYLMLLRGKQERETSHQKIKLRQLEVPLPVMMTEDMKRIEIEKWTAIMQGVKTCDDFAKKADMIPSGTLHFHEDINPHQLMGGLDKVLEKLPVGVVSEALPVSNKSVMFFMVCDRKEASEDEIDAETAKGIEEQLLQKKLHSTLSARMKNMQRRAHIDIRI